MAYETPAAAPSPVSVVPAVPYGQPAVAGQGQLFTPGLAAQQPAGQGYFAPPQPGVGQPQIPALGQVPGQPQQGYAAAPAGYGGVQGVTEGMRGMGMGDKVSR
jgi:hypothetical protein